MNDKMQYARDAAKQSRCKRRAIGTALFDIAGNLIATGFNGTPEAMASCFDKPCPAANVPAGQGDATTPCFGIHAEVRALMKCDPKKIHFVFTTKAPCTACTLMLLNTAAALIVFDMTSNETQNRDLWVAAGREWICMTQKAAA